MFLLEVVVVPHLVVEVPVVITLVAVRLHLDLLSQYLLAQVDLDLGVHQL
tara:strand:- start:488 stop:637 length:150 start_codon:yes stop_codon:yes gene_type:complete